MDRNNGEIDFESQQLIELFNNKVVEYKNLGYSEFEAIELAKKEMNLTEVEISIIEDYDREYPLETKLSKISASLIGQKIRFKALVVGEVVGKAIETEAVVYCKNCRNRIAEINLENHVEIFYEKLSTGGVKLSRYGFKCDCDNPNIAINFEDGRLTDYSILFLKELPEQIEAFCEAEYQSLSSKTWRMYYFGIPKGDIKRVEVIGYVLRNFRTNEIELASFEVRPLEEEFSALKITKEDHQQFLKYFKNNLEFDKVVENQIAPHIVSRNFEKLSVLLTLHSPCEIFDIFNSRKIRGCLRTIWIGDTKVGKSELGKDITYQFYKIGEMVFGETSSRAGLTYNIDTDSRTIIWGALPLNDKKFVFIDGIHSISSQEMEEMREVLEQQTVKVQRLVSGEKFARVRIIATINPRKPPMKHYYYKMQALMDTNVFQDPVDLTRWDIFVPFCLEDVPGDLIAEAKPKERPIPVEVFKKHVYWVWSLKPEQIKFTEDAKEGIINFSKELFAWVSSEYPLIHSGIRDVLTRLAVSFACLRHSVVFDSNGDFEYVEVRKEHVEMAKGFIEEMVGKIDYDAFVFKTKEQHELTEEEFFEIRESLTETELEILRQLVNGTKKSPELASIIGLSDRSIKEHYKPLRKYSLVETSQHYGVKLTSKGILFLKMLEKPKHFAKLKEPHFGKCAYCGNEKYLTYKDEKGSHLCEDCFNEEDKNE
ncbi:MAG: hypothetical protein QXS37_00840 [Candidatus Aenigmatarchaeota archaeon]